MYYIKKGLPSNTSNDPIEDLGGKKKKGRIKLSGFFCLLPLQRNPHLPFITVGFLSSLSATANLYIIDQTFNLTHTG